MEGSETTTEYERQRKRRIDENKERLERLGIQRLTTNAPPKQQRGNGTKETTKRSTRETQHRQSERLRTKPHIDLKDGFARTGRSWLREHQKRTQSDKDDRSESDEDGDDDGSESDKGGEGEAVKEHTYSKEWYSAETVALLGSHERPFANLRCPKLADAKGTVCHQCLQRTLDRKTECSECATERGRLCGKCLWVRYGENLHEAIANPSWRCPSCRGFCNCRACRTAANLEPVGVPIVAGFASVAHFLVLTHSDSIVK